MADDGIIIIVMTLDSVTGLVLDGPDIVSRGFVYVRNSEALMDEMQKVVDSTMEYIMDRRVTDWSKIKTEVKDAVGDFVWKENMLTFTPNSKQWELSTYDNYFYLTGNSYKIWLPNIDLRFLNDGKYAISGFYNKNQISNLKLELFNHEFTGSVSNNYIMLNCDIASMNARVTLTGTINQ
jgi:hypothetical protein